MVKIKKWKRCREQEYIDAAQFLESDVSKQFSFMHTDGTLFEITFYIHQNH